VLLSEKGSNQTFAEAIKRKYVAPEDLEAFGEQIRSEGKTLVTINGSFDLLHPGHLEMLHQAKGQGDVFLVLLNSDASIKANKSPKRPINPLEVRFQNIAALEMVDYVSSFEETNPISVLDKIKPDVHANGSEYGENCIEAEVVKKHGGRILIVKLVDGYSSTNLIKRIQELCV